MFFNLCRSTRSAEKEYNIGKGIITPKKIILNNKKRQNLKNVLLTKFMKIYKIKNIDQTIDNEITKFVQGEKLSDKDLQNLDNKIEKIVSTRKINRNLSNNSIPGKNNPLTKSQESLPLIHQNQITKNKDTTLNQTEDNSISLKKLRPSASVEILPKYKKIYKSPEEELADLEAEFAEAEPKKQPLKRLDFSGLGNEWYAMASYNKILYEKQLQEEKLKEAEIKRKLKEDLDNQIQNKLKKKLEEKLKEKEEEKIFQENLKQFEKIEKEKRENIKQKILKEKLNRESQIKNEYIRRRIDQLKQKKFELNIIKEIKEEMEKEKKLALEKRIKENEALKQVLKENEIYKEKQKELIKKQKEDNIEANKDMERNEIKKELARKKHFDDIRRSASQYDEQKILDLLNKKQNEYKEQDDKLYQLMLENKKKEEEEEIQTKNKKKEERIKLKQYLDKQIEEKKKEKIILKHLDEEQDKKWLNDNKKLKDEQIKIDNIIKNKNKKNYNIIKEQMNNKGKKGNIKLKEVMTIDEYAMNKEFLEKAKKELELRLNK